MTPEEEPAVEWVKDWDLWQWGLWVGLLMAAIAFFFAFRRLLQEANDSYRSSTVITTLWVLITVGTLVSLVAVATIPGTLMRHIEVHGNVSFVVIPLVLVVIALVVAAVTSDGVTKWVRAAGAGALGIGTVLGAVMDAASRAAASIPMALGAFLVLVVCGVAAVFLYAAAPRR